MVEGLALRSDGTGLGPVPSRVRDRLGQSPTASLCWIGGLATGWWKTGAPPVPPAETGPA